MSNDSPVFISWSGDLSKKVASLLKKELPNFCDGIEPWMSDEDIDTGARGLPEIALKLSAANFGIVVLTRENMNAPWINFEAGALSKTLDNSSRLIPLLVDIPGVSEISGPISQFQATLANEEGFRKLVSSLADAVQVKTEVALTRLEGRWKNIEIEIGQAQSEVLNKSAAAPAPARDDADILREVLEIARQLRKDNLRIDHNDLSQDAVYFPWPNDEIDKDGLAISLDELCRGHGYSINSYTRRGNEVHVAVQQTPGEPFHNTRMLRASLTKAFGTTVRVNVIEPRS